jgi:hypothetical protein
LELYFTSEGLWINLLKSVISLLLHSINLRLLVHDPKHFGSRALGLAHVRPELLSLASSHGAEHHSENSNKSLIWCVLVREFLLKQGAEVVEAGEDGVLHELREAEDEADHVRLADGEFA